MSRFKKIWKVSGKYIEFAQIRQVQGTYAHEDPSHSYFNADFTPIFQQTLGYEGIGYSSAATDAGNFDSGVVGKGNLIGSKFGISAPTLAKYLGRKITASDMQNLTQDTAEAIAEANYWDPMQGDSINSQPIAAVIFDSIYNAGGNGANLVRKAINEVAGNNVVDGSAKSMAFSSAEIDAINSLDPQSLFNTILVLRDNFDNGLSSAKIYGKGWKNRLDTLYTTYSGSFSQEIKAIEKNPSEFIALVKRNKGIAIAVASIAVIGLVYLLSGKKQTQTLVAA